MRGREVFDHEWVSQRVYVDDDGRLTALNMPRPKDNDRLSVILGRVSPAEAYNRVRLQARRGPLGIAKRFVERWRRSLNEQLRQTDELERKRDLAGVG